MSLSLLLYHLRPQAHNGHWIGTTVFRGDHDLLLLVVIYFQSGPPLPPSFFLSCQLAVTKHPTLACFSLLLPCPIFPHHLAYFRRRSRHRLGWAARFYILLKLFYPTESSLRLAFPWTHSSCRRVGTNVLFGSRSRDSHDDDISILFSLSGWLIGGLRRICGSPNQYPCFYRDPFSESIVSLPLSPSSIISYPVH